MNLCFLTPLFLCAPLLSKQEEGVIEPEKATSPRIQNPYFEVGEWRIWRDDASPVLELDSMQRVEKEEKAISITLKPIAVEQRVFPKALSFDKNGVLEKIVFAKDGDSKRFAGMWDDVYASWSGLHGYVRPNWRGVDESWGELRTPIDHGNGAHYHQWVQP